MARESIADAEPGGLGLDGDIPQSSSGLTQFRRKDSAVTQLTSEGCVNPPPCRGVDMLGTILLILLILLLVGALPNWRYSSGGGYYPSGGLGLLLLLILVFALLRPRAL